MGKEDLVLSMLASISEDIKALSERVTRLEERISWRGIVAGGIPSLAALAYVWLSK